MCIPFFGSCTDVFAFYLWLSCKIKYIKSYKFSRINPSFNTIILCIVISTIISYTSRLAGPDIFALMKPSFFRIIIHLKLLVDEIREYSSLMFDCEKKNFRARAHSELLQIFCIDFQHLQNEQNHKLNFLCLSLDVCLKIHISISIFI